MKIFVAIDDIKLLDGGRAGEFATLLTEVIEEKGWGKCEIPSRHRLYPHPDTNCIKHNTVRSFSAEIQTENLDEFIEYARNLIKSIRTSYSNPGLAIAIPTIMNNANDLIDYAYRVKEQLVSKAEALALAEQPGLYLFELGGNGQGIIGALAGAGLRITGNDGQFRGKLQLSKEENYIASVAEIIDKSYVEQVKNMDFEKIGNEEHVRMGEKVKIVLLDHQYTLMVFPTEIEHPKWQTSTTNMLRIF